MIKYKLQKNELTHCVFPQQVETHPFTLDDLKEIMRKRYGALSAAVIDDTFHTIAEKLTDGSTVSLDGFGFFSLRLGMAKKAVRDYEDVHSHDIRVNGIRFKAARQLRDSIEHQKVHQQQGDKVRRTITADERWHMLHDHLQHLRATPGFRLNEHPITIAIYRTLTGCTDYTARKELSAFVAEGRLREIRIGRVKGYTIGEDSYTESKII